MQELSDILEFDFQSRTRVVFGAGILMRTPEFVREIGASRVLLVTDSGIVKAGHAATLCKLLESSGLTVTVFDRVHENPTTDDVDACVEVAREAKVELIIGLGGGSSLDTAKGCNFILTNGGRMQDYWGVGKATRPMLPLIAIPTTAGTGSECQSFALISDADTHQKMACGDPKAAARVAILDPQLTLTQPRHVTACTGIDTLAHAVEAMVTRKRNALSTMFAREAFRLGHASLERVLESGDDIEARADMQLAAALAGMAIENSMLGAAHAAANPLTARYDVVHGQAVGIMLPFVVRWNSSDPAAQSLYLQLASTAGLVRADASAGDALDALIHRLNLLLDRAGFELTLTACGVEWEKIPKLAEEAAAQWTASFNPVAMQASDFVQLYESAFTGRAEPHAG